jgi:hypothetical protein
MRYLAPLLIAFPLLSACAVTSPFARLPQSPSVAVQTPDADSPRPQSRPVAGQVPGTNGARSPEMLDRTSEAQRAAALVVPPSGGAALGETLAALGSPTEQGFWLRTGLVDRVRSGRVSVAQGGSVAVELRPSGQPASAGSQLSLAAFRALNLPLTQLVNLQVSAE